MEKGHAQGNRTNDIVVDGFKTSDKLATLGWRYLVI